MTEAMLTDLILPIITSTIGLTAFIIGLITWQNNLRQTRIIQHYSLIAQADSALTNEISCLRFHGVDPETVEASYGVTSKELLYLLTAFNAGSISNQLSKDGCKKPFEEGDYWYGILRNKPTQKAFDLLATLFAPNNPFIERCRKTIPNIQSMDK